MKKAILAASLALCFVPATQADIFISEYVEGSSNNKALELFNPTNDFIDLTGYRVRVFANGRTSATGTISLAGSLGPQETYVITHGAADETLKALADMVSNTASWNGNDAIVLEKNGETIDSFGRVGEDPGRAWSVDGVSTMDMTLRRKAVLYDTTPDDEFNPAIEWAAFPKDDFSDIGRFILGSIPEQPDDPTDPDDPTEPDDNLNCGASFVPISVIQGPGDVSPLLGQNLITEGIVTHRLDGLKGFMLQAAEFEYDDDPLTSEGVFVYVNNQNVAVDVGQRIRIQAVVGENFRNTQLQNIVATVDCGFAQLPAPKVLSLPLSAPDYLERYEGMLVTFEQELTVNGNFTLGRFGELVLANGRRFTPTQVVSPGAAAVSLAASHALNKIVLDDASTQQNPAVVPYPAPGLSAINTVRSGDTVTGLTGTLFYSFNEYRLNPTEHVNFIASNPRTSAPELAAPGNLKIASFNVLNYFNGDGLGGGFPTSRGADSLREFERQRDKILSALTALDAAVIGLMELENDGFSETSAIADLVSGLRSRSGHQDWQFVAVNSPKIGSDQIAVGLIYRSSLVTPAATAKILDEQNSALDSTGTPLFDTTRNRPMLAQRFKLIENDAEFAVMVNHLKSKGSACANDPDLNDGQGNCNRTRARAAEAIGIFATTHFSDIPAVVLGDLNAYAKEEPLTTLASLGYVSAFDVLNKENPYGYVFSNLAGQLDHMLLNGVAQEFAIDVTEWHINADEPIALDYNLEFKSIQQQVDYYAPDAYRSSDHDPLILSLNLLAPLSIDLEIVRVNQANRRTGAKLVQLRWQSPKQGLTLYRDNQPIQQLNRPGMVVDRFNTFAPAVEYKLCYDQTGQCSELKQVTF